MSALPATEVHPLRAMGRAAWAELGGCGRIGVMGSRLKATTINYHGVNSRGDCAALEIPGSRSHVMQFTL